MKLTGTSPALLAALLGATAAILIAGYYVFIYPALQKAGNRLPAGLVLTPITNTPVAISFTMPRGRPGELFICIPDPGVTNLHGKPLYELPGDITGRIRIMRGSKSLADDAIHAKAVRLRFTSRDLEFWPVGFKVWPEETGTSESGFQPGTHYTIDLNLTNKANLDAVVALVWWKSPRTSKDAGIRVKKSAR